MENVHAIEWFFLKELGRVCLVDTAELPPNVKLRIGDSIKIDNQVYVIRGLDRAVHGTRVGVIVEGFH